jgi:phage gp29-like protein
MNTPPELPPTANEKMPAPTPDTISFDEAAKQINQRVGAGSVIRNDPGFAPPGDPLKLAGAKPAAQVVLRDIPVVVIQNAWGVDQARDALAAHMMGIFERSAQLCDSALGDDRVIATLGSRRAGLFGRDIRHKPANDSAAAREVFDAWVDHWPQFSGDSSLGIMSDYEVLMGFSDAQLVWDTTRPVWKPYMRHWHARYQYWNWDVRKMVALTQDGAFPVIPGNGKWVHHSRFGYERCWIRGALRAIAEPFLGRHWGRRDWFRWSEKHGLATLLAETPMAADPVERSKFVQQVANVGSEATILLGKGVDEHNSYDLRLLEATDRAWEGFPGLIDSCDMSIVLALLFQNLTTEVKGGSFAATSAHMDIRDSGIQDDNAAWRSTLHSQVARPFAFFNFGDADLAPWTEWDVASRSQYEANAKQMQAVSTGQETFRRGGVEFEDPEAFRSWMAKRFGLDGMPKFKFVEPVKAQPEAAGDAGTPPKPGGGKP